MRERRKVTKTEKRERGAITESERERKRQVFKRKYLKQPKTETKMCGREKEKRSGSGVVVG